ncbi:Ribosomal L1 domain-containing protein 1 [Chytridiales sp. JEL 0842]|nr:Ribosomal L1 domain-containing protein 1 [Chytridiales sp. JEL 0842]
MAAKNKSPIKKALKATAPAPATTAQEPIRNLVDPVQIEKAVKALIAFLKNSAATKGDGKKELLEDATALWLIVGTKKMPDNHSVKPIRIPLKHAILPTDAEICLFTKDPQKDFKALLEEKKVTGVDKVIGISKLRANYKPYEAKRQLCASYQLFMADERILPLLPEALGKTFFQKKKQPVPINMTKSNLAQEFESAKNATYLHIGNGLCSAIKVAHTELTPTEIVENIEAAIPLIVNKIPRKWSNIQSIHLKTSESASLPLYNALPDVEATPIEEGEDATMEEADPAPEKKSPAKKEKKDAVSAVKGGKVTKKQRTSGGKKKSA